MWVYFCLYLFCRRHRAPHALRRCPHHPLYVSSCLVLTAGYGFDALRKLNWIKSEIVSLNRLKILIFTFGWNDETNSLLFWSMPLQSRWNLQCGWICASLVCVHVCYVIQMTAFNTHIFCMFRIEFFCKITRTTSHESSLRRWAIFFGVFWFDSKT